MPRLRFTDTAIRALPDAVKGTEWYNDETLPGFQLAVGQRSRSFYVTKSINGRNVRKRLGQWPGLPAAGARKEAEKLRGTMSQGIDPRRKTTLTLEQGLEDYIADHMHPSRAKISEATADEYRATLKRHCSRWLKRDMGEITAYDVEKKHKEMADRPYAANRLIGLLRALYRYRGIDLPLRKGLLYRERRRQNKIDDLAAFRDRVMKIDWPPKRNAWLFGCFTGIRREALCGLRWEQIDLDDATVHLEKMKNGLDRTLPLSTQAVALLDEMKGLNAEFVFPRRDGAGGLSEPRDEGVGVPFHNTRNVFSEAAFNCLLPEPVIGYLRGDKLTRSVAEGYVTRLDTEVLREAANKIGTFIEGRMQKTADTKH